MALNATTNPLKSFAFIKSFSRDIIDRTNNKLQMETGHLQVTGVDTKKSHSELGNQASEADIRVQKGKTPHDRLIDYYI